MRTTILEECGSTNAEAKDREKYSHGDAVIALNQAEGRGQRGRSWESAPGKNLTFSIVLEPVFLPAATQFLLSEAVALAVADTLSFYGLSPRIKWTNDIYVGDKKICGILLEHELKDGNVSRTVAGIGINVNQAEFPDWVPNPTSLLLETGIGRDVMEVFDVFDAKFTARYATLENGGGEAVSREYNDMLYRRGEPHRYFIPGRGEVEGTIERAEDNGELVVGIEGKLEKFLFREIEFIL